MVRTDARYVYRWDLDKTYLRTEFDTVRDLVRTAVEAPRDKRTVPGAASLMRELQRTRPLALHVLSGSPEPMRGRLEAKLRYDGIVWDSFTLKPTVAKLLEGNFRYVREQLGYKLSALLGGRRGEALRGPEILFGDDAEADAYIYSLYADVLAARVDVRVLRRVLSLARVDEADTATILGGAERVPGEDVVEHVFIHLERVSSSRSFSAFGPRVTAFHNYFQPALVLVDRGVLSPDAALRVAGELMDEHAFDVESLHAAFLDLVERRRLSRSVVEAFRADAPAGTSRGARAARLASRIASHEGPLVRDEGLAPRIDYEALFVRDRARAHAGKLRAKWRGPAG